MSLQAIVALMVAIAVAVTAKHATTAPMPHRLLTVRTGVADGDAAFTVSVNWNQHVATNNITTTLQVGCAGAVGSSCAGAGAETATLA